MTPLHVAYLVAGCCALIGAGLLLISALLLRPLRHRGELADAPDGADEACAMTRPAWAEYVPPAPHPDLHEREREMAGSPAAWFADLLEHRSSSR